eukprot:gene10327-12679_t
MTRKLKYHEQKLLKKVNFHHYKKEDPRDNINIARYGLSGKEEYFAYTKIAKQLHEILTKLGELDEKDPVKHKVSGDLADKLFNMGVIDSKSTSELTKITAANFCRRRASYMLVKLKMAKDLKHAFTLLSHGHIRIGPEVIKDPATLITRKSQDFITWVDTSSMKRKVMEYNGELDDYDLLQ